MFTSFAHEVIASVVLGVANHIFFHHYEPTRSTLGSAVALLAIQPCLLSIGIGLSGASRLSPPLVLRVSASFLVALSSSIALYRISPLHPLSNVPGPFLAKFSKIWSLWVCWTGRHHIVMKHLHDKYGPVVRTGPNEISTIEISAVAGVLGASGLPKGKWYSVRQDLRAPKSILSLSGDEHAKRRRLWNRGLSWQALRDHETTLWQRAHELLEGMSNAAKMEKGKAIDVDLWLQYFTFDFMGDMAFGQGSHMVRDGGDTTGLLKELKRFSKIRALLSHVPWAFEWAHILPFASHQILGVRDYGMNCARNRIQRGPTTKDLWYYLNDEGGLEKQRPPTPNVLADGMTAVIAGSDTTAAVMSTLLWCLLAHPDCYKRVEEEIDELFCDSPDGEIPYAELQAKLVYLEACINESMRYLPVVPTNGPREIPARSGGRVISGVFLPEGTQVYVPPYSLHRNHEYFSPSPDQFLPGRWMLSEGSSIPPFRRACHLGMERHDHNLDAFLPFSYGPANCVGRNLAKMQITLTIALLLRTFRFSFAEGFDWEGWPAELKDYFVVHRSPLYLSVVRR